jgi:hypothetical protein
MAGDGSPVDQVPPLRLPADRQLLSLSGQPPMTTARVDYRTLRLFARRADPNPMYCRL